MVLGLIDGVDERKENNRVVLKHSGGRNEMVKEMVGENESRPAKRTGGEGSEGASDKDQERGADENDGRREKCDGTIEERINKLSVDEWMKKKQSPLFIKLVKEEGEMEVVEKRWPTIIKKEIETSRECRMMHSFLEREGG